MVRCGEARRALFVSVNGVAPYALAMLASLGSGASCGRVSADEHSSGNGGSDIGSQTGGAPGIAQRADGLWHRVQASKCIDSLPRSGFNATSLTSKTCSVDQDCAHIKHGFCNATVAFGGSLSANCDSGCVEDADCGPGRICECGWGIGECVSASCSTDADCGGGLCARVDDAGRCDDGSRRVLQYLCTSAEDTCLFSKDCATFRCGVEHGARACLETVDWLSPECAPGP